MRDVVTRIGQRRLLRQIIRHEWTMLTTEPAAVVALGLFAVMVVYALLSNAAVAGRQREAAQRVATENDDRLGDLKARAGAIERQIAEGVVRDTMPPPYGPRHPVYAIAWGRQYAAMPPAPLALLSVGHSDLYPQAYEVATNVPLESFTVTEQTENPLKMLMGYVDFEFVVVYLYPLLIVGLTFNLVTQEREQGTLALLLSQPLSMRTLVVGKIAARAIAMHAVLAIASGVGLLLSGANWATVGALAGLGLVAIATASYGFAWLGLVTIVSSRAATSAGAALVLVACWLLAVVLQPAGISFLAAVLYPAPSPVEFVNARRAADADVRTDPERLEAAFFASYPEYAGYDVRTELGREYIGNAAEGVEMERRIRAIRERLGAQRQRQQALMQTARVMAPAMLLRDTIREIAGTGASRHEDFVAQVNAYQQQWRGFFWGRTFLLPALASSDYDRVPRFAFRERMRPDVARHALMALALLGGTAVAIGVTAARTLSRTYV